MLSRSDDLLHELRSSLNRVFVQDDVIVEIAGQSITNIYDYTNALDLLTIGQREGDLHGRGRTGRDAVTPAVRKQWRSALYDLSGSVKSKAIVAQHDAASEAN